MVASSIVRDMPDPLKLIQDSRRQVPGALDRRPYPAMSSCSTCHERLGH
jgi:hypothetical protein